MSEKPLYHFIFVPIGGSKVIMESKGEEDETPTIAVMAETYKKAVNKILRLKLPYINSEEDIKWQKVEEYLPDELDDDEGSEENHLVL